MKMYNLVNSNFNRTYNPSGRQNALSDIKRLLTSRDVAAQSKACGYLIEVVSRYSNNSQERARMIEYLLDNDIIVFLCEATSNLDFSLFTTVTRCLRVVWRARRFFAEEHAALALAAALRALQHYAHSGPKQAVDACMHFLCDLLNGISVHQTSSPLSHQSAYSAVQLLACLSSLAAQIHANQNTILSSALVLEALISYQPENLIIKGSTASALVEVLRKWFDLVVAALQHAALVGDSAHAGMLYVVLCQLGISALNLQQLLWHGVGGGEQRGDFVQSILTDEGEVSALRQCAGELAAAALRAGTDLVGFTKEHQSEIPTEEYGVFLKFLLQLFQQNADGAALPDFCDLLFNRGYLLMLPQVQILRNDPSVRKASTLVLGELLKVLAAKYLTVDNVTSSDTSANDIHMGLVELQYGIERPQSIGTQLQKGQPYSLLIYIYFYCQSSENPKEATAPLLPSLVEHILRLPTSFQPPPYIIKALWLVFAMSTISNTSIKSLEERVYLEKATERLVSMLQPDSSVFYSHNPALLLWAFTSLRIPNHVRFHVISQWLKFEESLPTELVSEASVWEILLNILVHSRDKAVVEHCVEALHVCLDEVGEDVRDDFSNVVWGRLPEVLSKALLDDKDTHIGSNICYFLELATTLLPLELDPEVCSKTALFVAFILAKDKGDQHDDLSTGSHLDYVCLKLSLYLLGLANNMKDNRILLTFINRHQFLQSVLAATNSPEERVACAALQLLSYVVHYFTRYGYQPKSVLELQTHVIIGTLRRGRHSEQGVSLLQLVYIVLNSGTNSPLTLAYDVDTPAAAAVVAGGRPCAALRALMFRIQLMLCCRVQDHKNQSSAGWKTLSSIFKHAIYSKNDTKLTATLTSQPWTHTLIQFQLTQDITPEFMAFLHSWLTLLRTTMKRNQEQRRVGMSRHSMVMKTMLLLKKEFKVEAMEDGRATGAKILETVKEILHDTGLGVPSW